jgi:signal transduction histidine kinase/DNA-binding response OmpR family regulator
MKVSISKIFIPGISKGILLVIFIFSSTCINAQQNTIDSLKYELTHSKEDSTKVKILILLALRYIDAAKLDSTIQCYQHALELVQGNKYYLNSLREVDLLTNLHFYARITGNYSMSMKYAFKALALSEPKKDAYHTAWALVAIGNNYLALEDNKRALDYFFRAKKVFEIFESGHQAIQGIAETYFKMSQLDSALFFNEKAYYIADTSYMKDSTQDNQYRKAQGIRVFANIYAEKGDDQLALKYYRQFITDFYKYNLNNYEIGHVYFGMAKLYRRKKEIDSSIFYSKGALTSAQIYNDQQYIFNSSDLLYHLYDSLHKKSEALQYYKISVAARDSMAIRQVQNIAFNEQIRIKENQEADLKEAARTKLIIVISGIIISLITFLIWNRIRQLKLRYKMILERKEAEKLKAIDKMKDKFFSNITHELRTPLSLILSPVELYLRHPEQLKDPNKLLQSIYKNSSYLLSLINQLLDISKLDARSMTINLSQGDFGNYIGELTNVFEEDAARKQLTLHFENKATGKYLFDNEHWKKIVNNLLSNAIKFTSPGGDIYVSVNRIAGLQAKDDLQLIVKDSGIGINEDQLPFIADRFYQADNTLVRKYEGAGIGLALVNELVKLMRGNLEIDSEEGKGSVFTVTATLESAEGEKGYLELPSLRTSLLLSNTNYNYSPGVSKENTAVVLIVEDNAELKDFLQGSLESIYKIITASNGEEGFQIASSQLPDIIISDVMMPVMDGFEFCTKIKNDPATSHIAFIILSAKANYESKMTGLESGADDYLIKPFSVDELLSRIKNLLQHQSKLREYNHQQLLSEDPLPAFPEVQNEFLQRIYKNIEDNLDDTQLTVEFLAAKMALTEGTLNRKLLTNIGLSANELIKQYHHKRTEMQKQMLELEAKALRAQMNPHFIFNCLNSIKSLIQQNENKKSVTYLTTFSKLIRTLFNNADKRDTSLYDEIETCKLYIQLESMRFGNKFNYNFNINETIDLKSVQVPALLIQPFVENAIWHGIMPKESGGTVTVSVEQRENNICCTIDDNGIGREVSKQNKFRGELSTHQSKGIRLTQSRLDLDNTLHKRNTILKTTDKKDAEGKSLGTIVVLTFKEY